MIISEFTDRDGDALTTTTNAEGAWITCTSARDEVTVGPFPFITLGAALAEVGLTSTELHAPTPVGP